MAIFSGIKRRPGQKQLHCERLEDRRLLAGDGAADSLDADDLLSPPDPLPPLESGWVRGRKWEDLNADGHQNDGEPGLAEVTIYSDRNFNGRFDTGEPYAVTMQDNPGTDFDESGRYVLGNLRPGFHMVREIVPEGFKQTFPSLPSGYQPPPWGDANAHVVFVDAGATVEEIDFGNQRLGLASVEGRKWEDLNGNGQRETDERGLSGVVIYADLNYNGALDDHEPHTVTRRDDQSTDFDEGGLYALKDMRPGRYVIREVVPEGYRQTFPRGPIPLAPQRAESEIEVTGAAAYTLWRDVVDANTNDETGKADMNADGTVDRNDYAHWKHNFSRRPEVEPVPAPPFHLPSPGGHDVLLRPGQTVEGVNFGNQKIGPGSISGLKWLDKNGNGQQDRGEPGLSGVTIYVDLNRNGVFNDHEPHTVTRRDNPRTDFDETGIYELDDLRPGWHVVREIVPAGYRQTFPHGPVFASPPIVPQETTSETAVTGAAAYTLWRNAFDSDRKDPTDQGDANADGMVDRNDYEHWKRNFPGQPNISPFPIRPVPSPSSGGHVVNVQAGQTATNIDFGNQMIGPSSIRGLKWLDENGNGRRDPQEQGLPGVTIYADQNFNGIFDANEPHTVTRRDNPYTRMDEAGMYRLKDLRPGWQVIREVVPDGFRQTYPVVPVPSPLTPIAPSLPIDLPEVPVDNQLTFHSPMLGAHIVYLASGQVTEGIDFGNQKFGTGSVHGIKWLDEDGNRKQDKQEPGLPGVTIYVDQNHNRTFDRGEPYTVTLQDDPNTDFDEAGRYRLDNLQPGFHMIREVVPDGYRQTFPRLGITTDFLRSETDDIALPVPIDGYGHHVFIRPGHTVHDIDFGNQKIETGTVHGMKWLDANGNGQRDGQEPGLPGVTIYADTNLNNRFDTDEPHVVTREDNPLTKFDESGRYLLEGLSPGWYLIREVVPDGYQQTFPNSTVIVDPPFPETDLEFVTPVEGSGYVVIIQAGGAVDGIVFGNQRKPDPAASIHGLKWLDENGNGQRDQGEPGLAGITIYVDANLNGIFDEEDPHVKTIEDDPNTTFDETGQYTLENLPAGEHYVNEVVPVGFVQTFPSPVGPLIYPPSPATTTPTTDLDTVQQELNTQRQQWQTLNLRDYIYHFERICFCSPEYVDPGLVHVVDGEIDSVEHAVTGDALDPGFFLTVEDLFNEVQAAIDSQANEIVVEYDEVFGNPTTIDIDFSKYIADDEMSFRVSDLRVTPDPGIGAHKVTLKPGEVVEGIDFGNQKIEPGSIHGLKWLDENGNGQRDQNEPGLAGVTIYVDANLNGQFDDEDPHVKTIEDDPNTTFDETGQYALENLPAGEHYVNEVVPVGFVQTFPSPVGILIYPPPPGIGAHKVNLKAGEVVEGIDFGNQKLESGSIHGLKWMDKNGNGTRERGEPGLPGVTIYIDSNRNGMLDDQEPHTQTAEDNPDTSSDESGRYAFKDLSSGVYLVREVIPDGYRQTSPTDQPGPGSTTPASMENLFFDLFAEVNPEKIELSLAPGETEQLEVSITLLPYFIRPYELDVRASLPDVELVNLTGPLVNGGGGDTSVFNVMFTGDGLPHAFDLQFVDTPFGGVVGPTIPVRINSPQNSAPHRVFVTPGAEVRNVNFGNQKLDPGSVHGLKWLDEDGDGQRGSTEPGLPGVTIYADFNHNGMLDDHEPRTQTMEDNPQTDFDEAGRYGLTDLPVGEHWIAEVVPDGFLQTFPSRPAIAIVPPPPGRNVHEVNIEPGDAIEGIDFGNRRNPPPTGAVHGIKWLDENGNREHDPNEPGVAGVTIYVDFNRNGVLDGNEPHTETMADDPETDFNELGRYGLRDVPMGEHWISEVVPPGFSQTFPSNPIIAIFPPPPGGGVHEVKIEPGDTIERVDFGNRKIEPGEVHGRKWVDHNGNGKRDPEEPGLPGVTIYSDANFNGQLDFGEANTETMVDDTTTDFDETGMYWLKNLGPGVTSIREVVPGGFTQTYPSPNAHSPWERGAHFLSIEEGGSIDGLDFGNRHLPIPVPEEPVVVVNETTAAGYHAAFEELPLEPSLTTMPEAETMVPASLLLDTTVPTDNHADAFEALFDAMGDDDDDPLTDADDLALNRSLSVGNTWANS